MHFFGKTLDITEKEIETSKKMMNVGAKARVLPETMELLNAVYKPFNERLANLLADDKWLYN